MDSGFGLESPSNEEVFIQKIFLPEQDEMHKGIQAVVAKNLSTLSESLGLAHSSSLYEISPLVNKVIESDSSLKSMEVMNQVAKRIFEPVSKKDVRQEEGLEPTSSSDEISESNLSKIESLLDNWVAGASQYENREEAKEEIMHRIKEGTPATLDLSGLRLKTLPDIFHLRAFKGLLFLKLQGNSLADLPLGIGNLQELKEVRLTVSKDLLESPKEIFSLPETCTLALGNLSDEAMQHLAEKLSDGKYEGPQFILTPLNERVVITHILDRWMSAASDGEDRVKAKEIIQDFLIENSDGKLVLSGLNISDMPNIFTFSTFTRPLKHMDLSNNTHLTTIPKAVLSLAKKSVIDLQGSHNLSRATLESLKKMNESKIEGYFILPTPIDDSIANALDEWVKGGSASENRARARDSIMIFLSNNDMTELNLTSFDLTSLPNIFDAPAFIQRLRHLKLGDNPITTLPSEIGGLQALEKLELMDCGCLTALPEKISSLPKTCIVDLQGAYSLSRDAVSKVSEREDKSRFSLPILVDRATIKTLDEWVAGASEGENRSKAKDLIMKFLSKPKADQLDLSGLNLNSLPQVFDVPAFGQRLVRLNLDGNHLQSLFPEISWLKQLKKLDLANCRSLTALPSELFGLSSRCVIDLRGVSLSDVALQSMDKIVGAKGYEGPGISLEHSFERTVMLRILDRWVESAPKGENRLKAKEIILKFMDDDKQSVLNLSDLNLTEIPNIFTLSAFRDRLKQLHLCHNRLTSIPSNIINLQALRGLDLTGCSNLTTLPEELFLLSNESVVFLEKADHLSEATQSNLKALSNSEVYKGPWISPYTSSDSSSISHRGLLYLVANLYKGASEIGICHGFALMATQAVLSGNIEKFNSRLQRLGRFYEQMIQELVPQEMLKQIEEGMADDIVFDFLKTTVSKKMIQKIQDNQDYDLLAFFEGIHLCMEGHKYSDLFDSETKITGQFHTNFKDGAMAIAASSDLEIQGKIRTMKNLISSGIYTEPQLALYFTGLKAALIQPPVLQNPIVVALNSLNHQIAVGYDPQEDTWIFIDANEGCTKKIKQEDLLAKEVIDSVEDMKLPDESVAIGALICMIDKGEESEFQLLQTKLMNWQDSEGFKSLQEIDNNDIKNNLRLCFSAEKGDVQSLQKFIEAKVPLDTSVPGRAHTALHLAILGGHTDAATALIDAGADVNKPIYPGGPIPLTLAVEGGLVEVTEALIRHKAKVNVQIGSRNALVLGNVKNTYQVYSPLEIARESKNERIIKLLEDALKEEGKTA